MYNFNRIFYIIHIFFILLYITTLANKYKQYKQYNTITPCFYTILTANKKIILVPQQITLLLNVFTFQISLSSIFEKIVFPLLSD